MIQLHRPENLDKHGGSEEFNSLTLTALFNYSLHPSAPTCV